MKEYNAYLLVDGIVQGVGFRPTVYRLAKVMQLNGYVRNMGNIVEIKGVNKIYGKNHYETRKNW